MVEVRLQLGLFSPLRSIFLAFLASRDNGCSELADSAAAEWFSGFAFTNRKRVLFALISSCMWRLFGEKSGSSSVWL